MALNDMFPYPQQFIVEIDVFFYKMFMCLVSLNILCTDFFELVTIK